MGRNARETGHKTDNVGEVKNDRRGEEAVETLAAENQELRREQKMLRLICDTSNSAFIYYNYQEDRIETIANWDHFFDFTVTRIDDLEKLYERVEEQYVIPLKEGLCIEKQNRERQSFEIKLNNSDLRIEVEINIVYDEQGNPTDKIVRFKDITRMMAQRDELTYMAYYDVLTGLYNRNYFVKLLGEFLRRAETENCKVAVMFLDIDDFRRVNDGIGIMAGDDLVQLFGQYLCSLMNSHVIISHFSTDLYCIGIYDPCGARSVETIYQVIRERLKKPFKMTDGQEVSMTVSVGVSEYPEAATGTLELINCAEIVMFKAKSQGKDAIQYFDSAILEDFLQTVTIQTKLREVVFEQNFTMYFQPQYYASNGRLRGVEALIRWKDEQGDMISPAVFIPIAEKNGAIVPIGNWVIEKSVQIYAKWRDKYAYPLILSLNISAVQCKQNDFIENILLILERYHIQPEKVELEITETILVDDFKETKKRLDDLRKTGIRISLDDFGTGFSSLSYLKGLPIDTLKIDKTFVDTLLTDVNTKIITESIIYMVKRLGYETVAEGVETEEQYAYLRELSCDIIQGYYTGKPMPAEGIENLLKELTEKV
ncbi:MAG: bifunctional diguanylate cyclase/phosphodiesterase [Lachnospiraceae bacterium]|nr:bifunctional diguanylate cyclase/phosphodiesterase [Lachnospiraceae bacterium]